MTTRLPTPTWGRLPAFVFAIVCVALAPAMAQPKKGADPAPEIKLGSGDAKDKKKPKTYDFNALDLNGRMRSPQLLYFLERANEELERASLEKRSFIPHMVRSLEEEQL